MLGKRNYVAPTYQQGSFPHCSQCTITGKQETLNCKLFSSNISKSNTYIRVKSTVLPEHSIFSKHFGSLWKAASCPQPASIHFFLLLPSKLAGYFYFLTTEIYENESRESSNRAISTALRSLTKVRWSKEMMATAVCWALRCSSCLRYTKWHCQHGIPLGWMATDGSHCFNLSLLAVCKLSGNFQTAT